MSVTYSGRCNYIVNSAYLLGRLQVDPGGGVQVDKVLTWLCWVFPGIQHWFLCRLPLS